MTKEEFKLLFDKYYDPVRRYLHYRGAGTELASDLAQDVFLIIWEKKMEIDPDNAAGLLYKIAGDMFISKHRREKLESEYASSIVYEAASESPADQLSYKELQEKFAFALASMDERQRTVFMMARIDGLKYHEIAERLHLSIKAIEKRMSVALNILRKTILKEV